MKRNIILASILAISLSLGNMALAKDKDKDRHDDRHDDRGRHEQAHRGNNGWERNNHDRGNNRYYESRRYYQSRAYQDDRRGSGAGRNHNFYRGDRLSSEYRHQYYVVDDWRGHRLSAPPRGYHWVQTGPDYVLVAIASGIIVQILLSH